MAGNSCIPDIIHDEDGNPYQSPPVPVLNLTVDTAFEYRNQVISTENPYHRGPYE